MWLTTWPDDDADGQIRGKEQAGYHSRLAPSWPGCTLLARLIDDRLEGDFTAQVEANLVRLASLTATALDALAQLHLPKYRAKVARRPTA